MKGRPGMVNGCVSIDPIGGVCEVMVKCGTKGGAIELNTLGPLGGGLIEEDASYSFLT